MMNESPGATDDFKLITGIGPAIERRLHEAGIVTYSQLAGLSAQDIAAHLQGLAGMSPERVKEQQWISQAREQAQLAPLAEDAPAKNTANGQHYATFTVELLLEETNEVRRTRVVHVQDRDTETWAGWDAARLLAFIEQQASLAPSSVPEASAAEAAGKARPAPQQQPQLAGIVEVRELQLLSGDAPTSSRLMPQEKPFDVRLIVDTTAVQQPAGGDLRYSAHLYARRLADGQRHLLGKSEGEATTADPLQIRLPARATQLDAGAYRLEVDVALSSAAGGELIASAPGALVQMC